MSPSIARQLDEVADEADVLAMTEPGSERALRAAQRSVEAAEALLGERETVENLRSAARASWRLASTLTHADRPLEAVTPAQRSWQLARTALEHTDVDDPLLDEVAGELMLRANTVIPVLAGAGMGEEAAEIFEACAQAVYLGDGPRVRQARARLQIMVLATRADLWGEARIAGHQDDTWAEEVSDGLDAALSAMDALRLHRHEGPQEVTEVARALQVVSRLLLVVGAPDECAQALDDAIGLASTASGHGETYRLVEQQLRAERAGLAGHVPDAAEPAPEATDASADDTDAAADDDTAAVRRAFARAAESVGPDVEAAVGRDLLAAPSVALRAAVDDLRAREASDPGRFGPQRGLLMAVLAWNMLRTGWTASAGAASEEAVRQLTRFTDDPGRVQASLMAALLVVSRAARASGQVDDAERAERRAVQIDRLLVPWTGSLADPGVGAAPGGPAEAPAAEALTAEALTAEALTRYLAQVDEGIELSRAGDYVRAEELLSEAESALTVRWDPEARAPADRALSRQVVRVRWRLSMVLHLLGRVPEAFTIGALGVDAGRMLLDALPLGAPELPEVVAEVATAATDLAETAFAAERFDEGFTLLDMAASWCVGSAQPVVRRAFGTALQNRANGLLNAMRRPVPEPIPPRHQVPELVRTTAHAVSVRRELRNGEDPLTWFELANSLLHSSIVVTVLGRIPEAAAQLAEATDELQPLAHGQAVDGLRVRALAQAEVLAGVAPQVVAAYRSADRWPTPT